MADLAQDLAKQLDSSPSNDNRKEAGRTLDKCLAEISQGINDPSLARKTRGELVTKIDEQEQDGIGLDLTIKRDPVTKQPKHYTILPTDIDRLAGEMATNFDLNEPEKAEASFYKGVKRIKEQEKDPVERQKLKGRFILAADAHEKDGPGTKDDIRISYDPNTHQPNGIDMDFAPKQPENNFAGELKTPKDGEVVSLDKLVSEYSAFNYAYKNSKTFKETIDHLKKCPWTTQVKFDSKTENPEYDLGDTTMATITVRANDNIPRQIEQLVHEGDHLGHQQLDRYFLHGQLSKDDYVKLKSEEEVSAYEKQMQVHKELTSKMPGGSVAVYRYIDQDGEPAMEDLSPLYGQEQKAGLTKLILQDTRANILIDNQSKLLTYPEYFALTHADYVKKGFADTAKKLQENLNGKDKEKWRQALAAGY